MILPMKYNINKDSSKSAYMQLYELLRNDIVQGVYTYGSKLPSKRLISEETGISVITVEHSYSILCDEGYVEAVSVANILLSIVKVTLFRITKSSLKKNKWLIITIYLTALSHTQFLQKQ